MEHLKRLTQIGIGTGTDKADYHSFTEFYNDYFEQFKAPKILEVGIHAGASLRMYDKFWNGEAQIVGVDIIDASNFFPDAPNIKTIMGDIMDPETIEKAKGAINGPYDIIIDDGGHTMEQQQIALLGLWEAVRPGGIFIMEDLHTSIMPGFNPTNIKSTLDILRDLSNGVIQETELISKEKMEQFYNEMESIIVAELDFPAEGSMPARTSITCLIVKKA